MRKVLITILLATIAVACKQDISEEIDSPFKGSRFSIEIPSTRTSLGEKAGDNYPIYWSDNDRIVINGDASTACYISEDKTKASFVFDDILLKAPYNLTYPYTEGSACADGNPTVVFRSEQHYVAGSFGVGDAPMYGYSEKSNGTITLSHLAAVVRIAVKGSLHLSTVEIIAEEGVALAGEFNINCQTGAMRAIDGKTSNKITYIADQQLSSDRATILNIVVPAGNLGVCKVVLTGIKGAKMNLKWDATSVSRGVVREMKEFAFTNGASVVLEEISSEEEELVIPGNYEMACGYIKYDDGTPAVGVSVSDGFTVVTTNQTGYYNFADGVNKRAKYIYYAPPADAKITTSDTNYLDIFKPYKKSNTQYDFTLIKSKKEELFSLFVIADTHGASKTYISRLKEECFPGVKREAEARSGVPCYTIVLGDIVCTTYTNSSGNALQPGYMEDMRNLFGTSTGGVPTLFVMGNHDYSRDHFDNPQYSDFDLFNYHAQDTYEEKFGPANYSVNRGDTHIVCMRDILWPESCITNKTSEGCYGGFLEEQIEWLRQDLANVTKDKKVILCVHIPLVERYDNTNYPTVKRVVDMIKDYNEPQIFSGHTHTNRDYKRNSSNFTYSCPVGEKTVVGNWGTGATKTEYGRMLKCMGDGAPFGFDVYDVSGAKFTDHYFVDCTSNKSHNRDTDYVMRVYMSSDVYGGDSNGDGVIYTDATHLSHERYFRFYQTTSDKYSTYFHVNLFNGSPDTWSVKLYVNNKYVKDLAWVVGSRKNGWVDFSPTQYLWNNTYGKGSGTFDDPWYASPGNSQDWWYISYMVNETSAVGSQTVNNYCHHKWYGYIPNDKLADIKAGNFYIEATHTECGKSRVYRTNKIFGQNDYNGYMNYLPKNN